MKPIINRVAKSSLVNIDLEDFYPKGKRVSIDIASWLYKGQILKEKQFRTLVSEHNWAAYNNNYVVLYCSTQAIIPSWAYLLITSQLVGYAKLIVVGNLELLEVTIFTEIINKIDFNIYKNKSVIIKGCAKKPIPSSAFTMLINKLQPVVKSLMYGEACSAVPIFKKK